MSERDRQTLKRQLLAARTVEQAEVIQSALERFGFQGHIEIASHMDGTLIIVCYDASDNSLSYSDAKYQAEMA